MIAKVSFELINEMDKNITYKFNTEFTELKHGQFVIVSASKGERIGVFVGYEKVNRGFRPTEDVIRKANRSEIKAYWQQAEDNLLKGNFVITDKVYSEYTSTFVGCENLSKEDATKKIARNIILSSTFGKNRKFIVGKYILYTYGSMRIYAKRNRVLKIEKDSCKGFKVNKRKRHYLNNVLGVSSL